MTLVGFYNPPTYVTLSGLLCGVSACLLALTGKPEFAVVALIWSGVFDLFDGMVARRTKMTEQEAAFGIQIDTVVDMVSFGIAPVLVAISLGMSGIASVIAIMLYVCAAAQRLAYFNVLQSENDGPVKAYTGLPVTFAALIFGALFMTKSVFSTEVFSLFITLIFVIVAALYVIPLKIPKPKGMVYIIMPLLACLSTVYWIAAGISP